MGRIFLIIRLAARDLRHRPGPAILLLIAITAATTTLTLGLALRGVSDQPYQQTRAATSGPDIVATVRLDGRAFRVAGVAVTAATTLLNPHICYAACRLTTAELARKVPGLIWATRADAISLATQAVPVSYTVNLKLASPANAPAFAATQNDALNSVQSWQDLSFNASDVVRNEQRALTTGSLLLGLLAIASVAVLVGWLAAPLLTGPGAGLLGSPGAPAINITTIGVVIAVALVATAVPALRATRISTVRALADAARTPRRHGFLTRVSSRLPAPLLLGVRLSARRPRRTLLSVASTAVAASGIVAVICVRAAGGAQKFAGAGLADPQTGQLNRVLLVLSAALVALAGVNAVVISWATVLDTRHPAALSRALGATPREVSAGLAVAQGGLALIGGLLGVPGGIGLFGLVNKSGESGTPSALAMAAVVFGSVVAVAAVTYIPAWLGTRTSPASVLAMEVA